MSGRKDCAMHKKIKAHAHILKKLCMHTFPWTRDQSIQSGSVTTENTRQKVMGN